MKKTFVALLTSLLVVSTSTTAMSRQRNHQRKAATEAPPDSASTEEHTQSHGQIKRLTEEDYREVAERLGIEVATIKAVVEIEAGSTHQGFHAPGQPIINFDMSMFRRAAGRNGINLSKYNKSHAVIFSRPDARRYGSTQAGQQARLKAARTIDESTAIQGCFWGMFQIGGFNWQRCGCKSPHEFAERMAISEREQLELFANFVINSGMLQHLKNKNWSGFARMYNGASYASRGYHNRLANAYARHRR